MLSAKVLPIVAALLLALAVAAGSAIAGSGPSQTSIRTTVAQTERSHDLWATVNVCAPRHAPHTIGVRAQMPGFGFSAQLSMQIQVEYFNQARHRFQAVPDPNAAGLLQFGSITSGLQQGGISFDFRRHSGLLRGTVTFRWRRGARLLLAVTRHTSAGHPNADQGAPARYSAANCRIR
jgi:hypothetical protein